MNNVLSVSGLRKVYPGSQDVAVRDISFYLKESEILGLLGPNGSGKTTTIQMLLGTLSTTSGSIAYFGQDFSLCREAILQNVSFASAYTSLPWSLSIEESLIVFGYLYGLSRYDSRQQSIPLLERFGLASKKKERIGSLSAGQMTRLMLVKAFFVRPRIVLLDEPTASLDPVMAQDICNFIQEQRQQRGMSVIFTSHKMDEVTEVCDRVIFLRQGSIIADDTPERLALLSASFSVTLVVSHGVERMVDLISSLCLQAKQDGACISLSLSQSDVPSFLHACALADIRFSHIKIEEPSLEDYFLREARHAL